MKFKQNQNGSILIFSVWVITFLTVFAVTIGLNIRGRMSLLSRLEARSQLSYYAQSGMKKAMALIRKDLELGGQNITAERKYFRHNNPENFSPVRFGRGGFTISYNSPNSFTNTGEEQYGIIDEERKLNINTAEPVEMKRLFELILEVTEDEAKALAEAIYDWREMGRSQPSGFYSDDYYASLPNPYPVKDQFFEVLEELLLVQGINQLNYEQMLPYITIYNDGPVNVNTALPEVLMAIGFDSAMTDKIIATRRGNDGLDNTMDDVVYRAPYDIASTVNAYFKLTEGEMKQIDELNKRGKLSTSSYRFLIRSTAFLAHSKIKLSAFGVFNAHENRLEYWREKY